MAFNVELYNFSKRENSTLRPSSSPTTLACVIKRGSGLISPKIELDLGLNTAPTWNYCYIPNFGRYYFISEWYNDKALWIANLTIDVLATYRTEIGSANLYALRSSASYDGRIVDNLYPTKANCTFSKEDIEDFWNPRTTSVFSGVYILGVVSRNGNYGSIKYYALNDYTMGVLNDYLLNDKLLTDNGFDLQNAAYALQKSLIDPMQYIKSCIYLPFRTEELSAKFTLEEVKIFDWSIFYEMPVFHEWTELDAGALKYEEPTITLSRTVNIPKHPQTTSRGQFTNLSPYTTLFLNIPPFGMMELDTTITCDKSTLDISIEIDIPTGLGVLTVKCGDVVLSTLNAQIGVPTQLSQVSRDYLGGVSSALGGLTGTLFNTVAGNVAGAIMSSATGISNACQSLAPKSSHVGSGGAYSQLYSDSPALYGQFFELVDDDIAQNGRPLCQMVNCSSGAGYYLIQDGDVAISGTREEAQQIKNYLETGFYWE